MNNAVNNVIISKSNNPYENLGLEEYLFDNYKSGITMYLWQNAHTIVIGASQNAYAECSVNLMASQNINLARRLTGGGAVYHHMGNLNFSFIAPDNIYDVGRQLSVILNAVKILGVQAEFSGRNDLIYNGKKFSGNAFKHTRTNNLHHGTLLIDEDKELMARYLTVSPNKIASKGVKSVQSRVINLKEINPLITVDNLTATLIECFQKEYGNYNLLSVESSDIKDYSAKFANKDWIFGKNPKFENNASARLSFGEITMGLNVEKERIVAIKVYSDTLDTTLPYRIEQALLGVVYDYQAVIHALKKENIIEHTEVAKLLFS